jgi:hypothetical protein
MLRLSRCTLLTLLLMGGCAKGVGPGNAGEGGETQSSGGSQGGKSASGGGSGGNSGRSGGSTASVGGSSVSSSGGTTTAACTPGDTTNLVSASTWICDATTPIQVEGSFYSYGDGSSCTTPSPLTCSASAGCCMSGATVVDTTYKKWGCGLGMELNDSGGTTPVKSVYSGPVKCFDITLTGSSGGNEVRIGFTQSTNTANMVSPFVSVAAFTSGWSGRVCFTDAECPSWALTPVPPTCAKTVGTAGTPFDLQIQVSAGSTAASVGAFNVCVTKIAPVLDPGSVGTTNSCSTVTGQGTLSGQYDTAHVTCAGQDYMVQNNAWGSTAGQTISYGPGTKFKVTVQNGTGANSAPASYPDIFIGANANKSTAGSGLPKAVSALSTVQTSWTWSDTGVSGAYNAAYDVWFSTSSAGDPSASSPSGGYLMVWLYKPATNSPIGSSIASATIAGNNWNVWYGTNSSNGKPCVSYAAQTKLNSLSFDLDLFIKDAVTRGYVQNSWSLTNVFSGFEIWSGGVGLQTTDFAVSVK